MNTLELLVILLLIGVAAFLSASEVALFSLSRIQLRQLKENFKGFHKNIKRLLGDPGGVLITIIVSNEIINVSLSTLIADAVIESWNPESHLLSKIIPSFILNKIPDWLLQSVAGSLVATPILLFLCEMTPKVTGARLNQVVAPLSSGPLLFLYNIFYPVRFFLKKLIGFFAKNTSKDLSEIPNDNQSGRLREEEFVLLLEEGQKEGHIAVSEMEMITNLFQLDNRKVKEIYTPISKILFFPPQMTTRDALEKMKQQFNSRVPIYDENSKEITGILYIKDILSAKFDPKKEKILITQFARKPFVIQQSMQLNAAFSMMRQNHTHIAVVHDQNKTIGILYLNDIIEELLEDIYE